MGIPENVKVVLIDTHYVVTDPVSFKSVVQNLTGKDSCVAWIEESSFSGERKRKRRPVHGYNNGGFDHSSGKGISTIVGDCKLSKGWSFKDLDLMTLEQPPIEEWQKLCDQYNL